MYRPESRGLIIARTRAVTNRASTRTIHRSRQARHLIPAAGDVVECKWRCPRQPVQDRVDVALPRAVLLIDDCHNARKSLRADGSSPRDKQSTGTGAISIRAASGRTYQIAVMTAR